MFFDKATESFLFDNKLLDLKNMSWTSVSKTPENLISLSLTDAVKKLQRSEHKIRIPISVIGANKPTTEQYEIAEKLGSEIANLGLIVMCGGRLGIMEAVCKGVKNAGGTSIGLLPENDITNANKFVTIPIATGIGFARNSIIASSALCLIAIGGANGTLSEIAYGLQFGKKVLKINSDLNVHGTVNCNSVKEVIENICKIIFNLP